MTVHANRRARAGEAPEEWASTRIDKLGVWMQGGEGRSAYATGAGEGHGHEGKEEKGNSEEAHCWRRRNKLIQCIGRSSASIRATISDRSPMKANLPSDLRLLSST